MPEFQQGLLRNIASGRFIRWLARHVSVVCLAWVILVPVLPSAIASSVSMIPGGATVNSRIAALLSPSRAVDYNTNPFRPVNDNHLNYYGSGDISGDNTLDWTDYDMILSGLFHNDRGDMTGDGGVSYNDAELLADHLNYNTPLPSDWLGFEAEPAAEQTRLAWLTKMIDIDRTDTLHGLSDWDCDQFTAQTMLNLFGFERAIDKASSAHDYLPHGPKDRFNLPVYTVVIYAPVISHALNAVLIGDHLTDFDDWYFFEPQNDLPASIGGWNMPADDCLIWILATFWSMGGQDIEARNVIVQWEINGGAAALLWHDTSLVQMRETMIALDVEDGIAAPALDFTLSQNYPNPFNATTQIEFELQRHSHVKLTVFNVFGQVMDVLKNECSSRGRGSVVWDGADFASGIYFYRLETENFTETKKMVLLK
jgi:hypothetical protein